MAAMRRVVRPLRPRRRHALAASSSRTPADDERRTGSSPSTSGPRACRALVVRPRRHDRRQRAGAHRALRRAPARLGGAGSRASTGRRSARPAGGSSPTPPSGAMPSPALTLTTQRGTVVVTDEAGRPLRPAIVWLDERRTDGPAAVRRRGGVTGLGFRALGLRDTVDDFAADCEAELAAGRTSRRPGRAIRHYLFLSGFLTQRLTGRFVDSAAAQVGYRAVRLQGASAGPRAGDWTLDRRPRSSRAWLPELVAADRAASASSRRGRRRGDGPAGSACRSSPRPRTRPARSSAPGRSRPTSPPSAYGTTATSTRRWTATSRRSRSSRRSRRAIPGSWSLEIQVYRGYWMVEWFKREFGHGEVARAAGAGRRAGGPLRRARRERAAGLDGPHPPAVLVTGRAHPRTGGQGRDHRLRRRPHPGARLPGHPRGARLRAARRRWSGRPSGPGCRRPRCASPAAARRARRRSSSRPTSSGCRWRAAHTHEASGLGAAIDAAVGLGLHPDVRGRRGGDGARRRGPRPGPRRRTRAMTSCIDAVYRPDVRPAAAALPGDPPDHRLPAGGR